MTHRRTTERQTGFSRIHFLLEVVDIVQKKSDPDELIRMLYEIADDAEAPANSRLTAIREILDRTVGKGVLLDGAEAEPPAPVEIVFQIVDVRSNTK